jgi:hypothetical protein
MPYFLIALLVIATVFLCVGVIGRGVEAGSGTFTLKIEGKVGPVPRVIFVIFSGINYVAAIVLFLALIGLSSSSSSAIAAPTTPPPTTPASTTPASTTPASTTPASTTPASTTPASTTPASTTPASTTPAQLTYNFNFDGSSQYPCSYEGNIHSVINGPEESFYFVNDSSTYLQIIWLNDNGNRVIEDTLASGGTYSGNFYIGDAWLIASPNATCEGIFVVDSVGEVTTTSSSL